MQGMCQAALTTGCAVISSETQTEIISPIAKGYQQQSFTFEMQRLKNKKHQPKIHGLQNKRFSALYAIKPESNVKPRARRNTNCKEKPKELSD